MAEDPMAQDLIRCDLCMSKPAPSPVVVVCNTCDINLCNECLSKHVTTKLSVKHDIVGFRFKPDTPSVSCPLHSELKCDGHCKKCNIPVCIKCLLSGSHKNHDITEISAIFNSQKEIIKEDTEELENFVVPIYENMNSELQKKVLELANGYKSMKKSILRQGKEWHDEVDIVIKKTLTKAKQMHFEVFAMLQILQSDMNDQLSKVRQTVQENKNYLKSNAGLEIIKYKSRLYEFRRVPPSFELSLPTFSPLKVNLVELFQMFAKLHPSVKRQIPGYTIQRSEESSQPNKQFLDKIVVNNINAGSKINSVCCVPNREQCITHSCGLIKRLDSKGIKDETIDTKSGNKIGISLTVTSNGNLVYSDCNDRSINMVHHNKIDAIIRLSGWYPLATCCTSSDDLLVSMMTDDQCQSKVVRYAGSTVTQEIQFDDQHKPLYSWPSFIEENKTLQVCVSDRRTVVVTDKAGKLMFRYDGNLSSKKYKTFNPCGLATDSVCHILVADHDNKCVHIINHKGRFLRYIDNCDLAYPWDMSISIEDNLYIVDCTEKVKMIKYLQ